MLTSNSPSLPTILKTSWAIYKKSTLQELKSVFLYSRRQPQQILQSLKVHNCAGYIDKVYTVYSTYYTYRTSVCVYCIYKGGLQQKHVGQSSLLFRICPVSYVMLQAVRGFYPVGRCHRVLCPIGRRHRVLYSVASCYHVLNPLASCHRMVYSVASYHRLLSPVSSCYLVIRSCSSYHRVIRPAARVHHVCYPKYILRISGKLSKSSSLQFFPSLYLLF
jgi:hypothetical protein